MNINHEPVATRLMIDIKHQPDRVLGAPAARQSGVCVPKPRWAGGVQPPVVGEGSSGAPERLACLWPTDTFF